MRRLVIGGAVIGGAVVAQTSPCTRTEEVKRQEEPLWTTAQEVGMTPA